MRDTRDGLGHAGTPLQRRVQELMPQLKEELARLVAIPSISEAGYPEATRPALLEAHEAVVKLFRDAGCEYISSLELPDTAPIITAEIPAPEGAPTVLLYSHYDARRRRRRGGVGVAGVRADGARRRDLRARRGRHQVEHHGARRGAARVGRAPAGRHQGRDRGPRRGRRRRPDNLPPRASRAVRGRRDADRGHGQRAARRAHAHRRPARDGETSWSHTRCGRSLRQAQRPVRRRGAGRAPCAIRALSTLHDERGNVAVDGLRRDPWTGGGSSEEEFRSLAEIEPGMPLISAAATSAPACGPARPSP